MKEGVSDAPASLPQWSIAVGEDAVDSPNEAPGDEAASLASDERYLIGEVLGVGGMGKVYSAYDRKLERHVALKELSREQVEKVGREVTRKRLLREARLTARIDHPGVVSIFDVGERADGTLFYTMRIVRGQSMATALKAARRDASAAARPAAGPRRSGPERASDTAIGSGRLEGPVRERMLRALLAACDAVGFGHRLGVVHRDLKPGNIMVGEFGETQVVDWGLARDLTETGESDVVGTPAYMSPEQARGEPADARSDVWSLGAVLHELLIGRPPHVDDSRSDSPTELVTRAREMNVPKVTGIDPELAAIVTRAIAKDSADRYPDARELAIDLANHLDGRRVLAHDYTTWQLLVRLARQWRGPLLAILVALVAGGAALGYGLYETSLERERALTAEAEARLASARAQSAEARAVAALADATRSLHRMLVSRAVQLQRDGARPEAEVLAARALSLDDSPEARGVLLALGAAPRPRLLEERPLPPGCLDHRLLEGGQEIVCRTPSDLALWQLDPPVRRWHRSLPHIQPPVMLGEDRLVMADRNSIMVLDPEDGELIAETESYTVTGSHGGESAALFWSANTLVLVDRSGRIDSLAACMDQVSDAGSGPLMATHLTLTDQGGIWAAVCGDGTLQRGTFEAGLGPAPRLVVESTSDTPLHIPAAVVFAQRGRSLFAASHDGSVTLLSLEGRPRVILEAKSRLAPIRELVTSSDSRFAVLRGERAGIALFDLETGTWLSRLPMTDQRSMVLGAPRELWTTGTTIKRWQLPEPTPLVLEHRAGVASLAVSKDRDETLIAVGAGEVLQRWRWSPRYAVTREPEVSWAGVTVKSMVSLGQEILAVSSGLNGMVRVDWHGDGLTSMGEDRGRRVAYLRERTGAFSPCHAGSPGAARTDSDTDGCDFEPTDADGWVLTSSYGPAILASPLRAGRPVLKEDRIEERPVPWFDDTDEEHQDLAVAPGESSAVALAVNSQKARRLVGRSGVEIDRQLEVGHALAVAIERDGDTVWTVTHDRLERWDIESGALLSSTAVSGGDLIEVAVSDYGPDGFFVAAGDRLGGTWLWRVRGRDIDLFAHFSDHTERVAALAFSDDGSLLLTGSWDRAVRVRALREETQDFERAWGLTSDKSLER